MYIRVKNEDSILYTLYNLLFKETRRNEINQGRIKKHLPLISSQQPNLTYQTLFNTNFLITRILRTNFHSKKDSYAKREEITDHKARPVSIDEQNLA